MANDIVNLPNSFIQFRTTGRTSTCNDYDGVRLPIYRRNDIGFMLRVNSTSTAYLDSLSYMLIIGDYAVGDTVSNSDIIVELYKFRALISGTDYVALCHSGASNDCVDNCLGEGCGLAVATADPGQCIHLVMLVTTTKEIVAIADPIFYYEPDLCWTKVVKYRCADNAYGFFYEEADTATNAAYSGDDYYNVIRLPITLQNPIPATQKTGFRKSDGEFLTLSAVKEKVWSVETDYLDDHLHTCLDAAIDHDELYVYDDQIAGCDYSDYEFFHPEDDQYNIDWQDKPGQHLGVAKASFKLKSNPYYSTNNNC